MNDWIDIFSEALGEAPVTGEETGAVLKLARQVAHGVERKLAPLSTFVLGVSVGRRMGQGSPREEAFREALAAALPVVPRPAEPGS